VTRPAAVWRGRRGHGGNRGAADLITAGDAPFFRRYTEDAVRVLAADERVRFLGPDGRARDREELSWELLYRLEPELYARLVAGERIHEGVVDWLPRGCARVLEIGAGTGRLTIDLAARAAHVTAVEPARPLGEILRRRLAAARAGNVDVVRGFFDDLPSAPPYDMVVSCSAFSAGTAVDREHCLRAMERSCARDGMVVLVWPSDVSWLAAHGFAHLVFAGPMIIEYQSAAEAAELARIFYPSAVDTVTSMGSRFVDFVTVGLNAPRDLCWKRIT
jgi:SAM-dependent methyltransferase